MRHPPSEKALYIILYNAAEVQGFCEFGPHHPLCHQGSTATSTTTGTLLYSTPREDLGLCVYGMLRPLRGMCISLWTPTGELMSSKSGPMRGV